MASSPRSKPRLRALPRTRTSITCRSATGFTNIEVAEGVYSHQTALSFFELSDLNPARLHLTVPTRFRRNSAIPGILVLHFVNLVDADIQSAQGLSVTRPLRTIVDLAETDSIERGFLRQAIQQALQRGLITGSEMKRAKLTAPIQRVFDQALKQVA